MGYTTEFRGAFKLSRQLTDKEFKRLSDFAEQRHGGNMYPFPGRPSMYCQWTPTPDRQGLCWDGNEKFYSYVEWLRYLNEMFLVPWGIALSGTVAYRGEEFNDFGEITVADGTTIIQTKGRISQT